jgi:trk system potassium uptake protein TrkH
MSIEARKSISYVLLKPVTTYMDNEVLILDQSTMTREATRMLQRYKRDDIVVTDENKKPIGIVTDEDILSKVSDVNEYAEATYLKDIMSSPLITIGENATLQDALHIMRDNKIRKLPVITKKEQVIGMILQVTIANVIRNATAIQPRLLSPPVKAILGNLGFVLQFAGVLLLVPAILATVLNDTLTATGIYLTTVLLLVTGFFLNSYGEKSGLNLRDASILVFSSLFILSLFGTIPYLYVSPYTPGSEIELFANSFFSSAAGFTTGGISLYDKPEELPQSFTFYRSFTQLVGGMSFIYLVMTAFYPERKLQSMRGFISGKTLHMRELFGTITVIFTLYIVIVALLLYLFGERNIIDNFSLAMSTLATGGFLPNSTILQNLVWEEHIILVYFGVLGVAIVFFTWSSGLEPLFGAFYSVSASTTAGLQLEPLNTFNETSQSILIVLMFIGGCGFSTAGGIKIYRFFHLKNFKKIIKKGTRKTLTSENKKEIVTTIIILMSFPLISAITALHLSEVSNADFADAFLDASGVITTGGLSANVITINTDPATKVALSFLMIIGRLEIIAIVYIFVPRLT